MARAARQFRPDVERQLEHEERLVAKKIVSGDLHFGREFTFINKDGERALLLRPTAPTALTDLRLVPSC